jgi:beta-glucosidase
MVPAMSIFTFPDSFTFGTATASYQIEGAHDVDGRRPSVWDTFSATPGRVMNNDTGMIACDHYHRYEEDVKLMAELGISDYRFSLAWPRILPDGTGAVNQAGLDFYKRLLDCLGEHGINPQITLFHWDSPQALEDRYGSWQSRQMAYDFADYVTVCVKAFGDRVTDWMTINEILCFTTLGYGIGKPGVHAPGNALNSAQAVQQTVHHALLAHGLATQAIRAATPQPCRVALVDNCTVPVPMLEDEAHCAAATAAFREINGAITVPALLGEYHASWLAAHPEAVPDMQPDDLNIIAQPLDNFGLNLYSALYVRPGTEGQAWQEAPLPPAYPRLNMPWLNVVPETIYWATRHINELPSMNNLPLFISENGCACDDQVNEAGEVLDLDRIYYLRQHFRSAQRAIEEGYPLTGYFVWSMLDNFEWAWGYDRRFGITRVDYDTQKRTPKASFQWYQETIKQRCVV